MTTTQVDRPAAIRKALRELVAEHGFHGSSMSAVAKRAGVAAGTAYVHYESKEELVYATYLEIKADLGEDVLAKVDLEAGPRERYGQFWKAIYEHLSAEPARAKFLTQLEESPYYETAHERLVKAGDPLVQQAASPDFVDLLVPLPAELLYSLSLGVAVRLAATSVDLSPSEIETVIDSTWRAITV